MRGAAAKVVAFRLRENTLEGSKPRRVTRLALV
jgi:hypothetical protein